MRYFVELSYLGKNYQGWQTQPNGKSVQATIERALSLLLKEKIAVVGCGRTDAGVHASQFFLHFDTLHPQDQDQLKFRLNSFLPKDIAILRIFSVPDDSHARFDAISRSYEYRILMGKDPFHLDTVCQITERSLDLDGMNEAAGILLDFKDFKCFSKSKTDVKTFDCAVTEAYWRREGRRWTFTISANRFLRNMVRAIVGTLLDVGQGKLTPEEFKAIIESRDRTQAGASAKASGLFLTRVSYPQHIMNES